MKRYKFNLSEGDAVDILAASFRDACEVFELFGCDPQLITSIEER